MPNSRITRKIISLNIDLLSYSEGLLRMVSMAKSEEPGYVCFANVHMTIEAYWDKPFANQVNAATLVLADGMPIVKALNFFYKCKQDRIAGMDVFPDLLKLAAANKLKVFFFGTTPELLDKINARAKREFPEINIAGMCSPPFDKPLNDESYIEMINSSGANMVFVALGCPKQEKWMFDNSKRINALLLGVGGAFPIYAETAKRAPVFMQKTGLEWMYRLLQEPNRLFKRYLVTNTLYIVLIIKEKLKLVFKRK